MPPLHILLLEDSDIDAELLQTHLQRSGIAHRIKRVWTRQDFLAAIEADTYNLILADYVLPSFDGMSALALASAKCPDTPFIFVSGTLGEEVAIESLKRGATDYVVKQRLDRLPNAVQRTLAEAHERRARRSAEQRLLEINATLEQAVEARTKERDLVWRVSQDLFVICDGDGTIRATNPAWAEILDWREHELAGHALIDLVAEEDAATAHSSMARLVTDAVVRDLDLRIRTRQGATRAFSWTLVKTPEGQFYGAGRDISHRLDLEAQLRQVQKMESIGQLTGGVAHDFNNLLTIVLGNLETLRRAQTPETPARLRQALANAVRGAERGAKLTSSLLAFSRRQPLTPQCVNVNQLVERLSVLLGRTLGEHIHLHTELDRRAWQTFVDPNQLENAVINLAVNARDAMQNGGTLTLRTSNRTLDEAYCAVNKEKTPGDYVQLAVSDTGSGMSPEVIAKAFDPFFTTKLEGQGTGLGLSQVYGFVKQSGGHVRIHSAPGQGTTVLLLLPRSDAAALEDPQAMRPESPALPAAHGTETILVVEDDPDVRQHSVATLADLGYRTLEAADGHQALARLRAHPEISLVFTDVGLPGTLNGKQMAQQALDMRPDLPILFTSAYASDVLLSNGRLEPGVALISKPYTVSALAQRVRAMLDCRPRPRVLLVEDDELVRSLAVEILEMADLAVEEAVTLAEARGKTGTDPQLERFAAIVVDLGLPDGSGEDLAQSLRRRRPALPIVILSGDTESGIRAAFANDPYTRFLQKPYRGDDLIALLRQALANGQHCGNAAPA
ncbi:response regulator [Orrella sp. JC864]|uniref:response regulator n=1 Tax=Orrella sp. JC864 TaxID=3120298 RepID=UPI00300903B3